MTSAQFKALRLSLSLSKIEIAEKLGVGIRTIQRYESGDRAISKTVELLLKQLKLTKSYNNKLDMQ
jgi:transcriptional regulator with XRE-family HTH domain